MVVFIVPWVVALPSEKQNFARCARLSCRGATTPNPQAFLLHNSRAFYLFVCLRIILYFFFALPLNPKGAGVWGWGLDSGFGILDLGFGFWDLGLWKKWPPNLTKCAHTRKATTRLHARFGTALPRRVHQRQRAGRGEDGGNR